jgi:hypothetical protein
MWKLPAWFATATAATTATTAGTPPATTATAAAEAIAAAARAPTESAIWLRPSLVHIYRSAIQTGPIQRSNRLVRFPFVFHFHKCEAARTARIAVRHNPCAVYHAVAFEQAPYRFFR